MKKKVLCIVLAVVMVLFCLTACATPTEAPDTESDPPSTEPDQDSEPVNEEEPEEAKTVEGYPDIAYGPVEGKTEADYQFGFSWGGVGSFEKPIPEMAKIAAEELGIPDVIEMTPQEWEQNQQNQMLDSLIASGCTGIMFMTSEAVAGNEQITKMVESGINVVTQGCPPGNEGDETLSSLTLCTDTYTAAYEGAKHAIEKMGGKGNVVALSGDLNDGNTVKRFNGVQAACDEYEDVTLIQQIGDIEDPEASMTAIGNLLTARADEIDAIVATTYETAASLARYMDSGDYPDIIAVCTDTDEAVITAIENGTVYGTMTQSPWAMGYWGMYALKLLEDGWTYNGDPIVPTGQSFIGQEDASRYEEIAKEAAISGLKDFLSNWSK